VRVVGTSALKEVMLACRVLAEDEQVEVQVVELPERTPPRRRLRT
jgi:hypothetical protein